jgi:hypothetical protein
MSYIIILVRTVTDCNCVLATLAQYVIHYTTYVTDDCANGSLLVRTCSYSVAAKPASSVPLHMHGFFILGDYISITSSLQEWDWSHPKRVGHSQLYRAGLNICRGLIHVKLLAYIGGCVATVIYTIVFVCFFYLQTIYITILVAIFECTFAK